MLKVAFHNLGCKVNAYEMDVVQQNFQKAGYEIVEFAQKADIYVINTCSVTNIADRKSRQMLHQAKDRNPEALVVAMGCYAQTDTQNAAADEAIDLLIGNNHKAEALMYVEKALAERAAGRDFLPEDKYEACSDIAKETEYENCCLQYMSDHTRAFIKIQDGCNQFCSYCIIPYARGRIRSRKREDIFDEIKRLSENGYKEVVLTGIHLSSYGLKDVTYNQLAEAGATNNELLKLCASVANAFPQMRIRLGSLEPRLLTEEFVAAIAACPNICPHFHLSLQSGCDTVLSRMNRHYTAEKYAAVVDLLRKYYEHPAVTTDVIAGFPGESEEEFVTTKEYLNRICMFETHIFAYSRRHGTVADRMNGQLTSKEKSRRVNLLLADDAIRRATFVSECIGKEMDVLLEEETVIDGKRYMTGYSMEYVRCALLLRDDESAADYENVRMIMKGSLACAEGCILICNKVQ